MTRRGFSVLLSTCKALHPCCSAGHLRNFINWLFPILFKFVVFHILLGRKHQQRWVLVTDVVCWYKNLHSSYTNLPQGNQKLARLKLTLCVLELMVTPPVGFHCCQLLTVAPLGCPKELVVATVSTGWHSEQKYRLQQQYWTGCTGTNPFEQEPGSFANQV